MKIFKIIFLLNIIFFFNRDLAGEGFLESFSAGLKAYKLGDLATAEREWLAVKNWNPGFRKVYFWLGLLYRDRGDLNRALFYFDEGLRREGEEFRAETEHQRDFGREFNLEQKRAVENRLERGQDHYLRGTQFLNGGQMAAALSEWRKGIAADPSHREMTRRLARLEWDLGHQDQSLGLFADMVARWGPEDKILADYLPLLTGAGRWDTARALINDREFTDEGLQKIVNTIRSHFPPPQFGVAGVARRDGNRIWIDLGTRRGELVPADAFKRHFRVYDPQPEWMANQNPADPRKQENFRCVGEILITRVEEDFSEALVVREAGRFIAIGDRVK